MPRTTKKAQPKRAYRPTLSIVVSDHHKLILKMMAVIASKEQGRAITESDIIRDWLWEQRGVLDQKNPE
jgi:hypothetical protein